MLTLTGHLDPDSTHGLWSAWSHDPAVWLGLATTVLLYVHGFRARVRPGSAKPWLFVAGIAAVAVAIVSPLDALSGALASAHMAQHLLLITIAAPLLVVAGAGRTIAAGLPPAGGRLLRRARRRIRRHPANQATHNPVAMAVLHTAVVSFWHAPGPYDAAVRVEVLHAVEHIGFLGTGLLAWNAALAQRGPVGLQVLTLFGLSFQSALLGALLTFAQEPLYGVYADTTETWGFSPLGDQQLAGVIMWVPGGLAYLLAALALIARLVTSEPADEAARTGTFVGQGDRIARAALARTVAVGDGVVTRKPS